MHVGQERVERIVRADDVHSIRYQKALSLIRSTARFFLRYFTFKHRNKQQNDWDAPERLRRRHEPLDSQEGEQGQSVPAKFTRLFTSKSQSGSIDREKEEDWGLRTVERLFLSPQVSGDDWQSSFFMERFPS